MLEEASKLFNTILIKRWDVRFDQIESVLFSEINRLEQLANQIGLASYVHVRRMVVVDVLLLDLDLVLVLVLVLLLLLLLVLVLF